MSRINFDEPLSPDPPTPDYYRGNGGLPVSLAGEADLAPPALPPRKNTVTSPTDMGMNGRGGMPQPAPAGDERPPALPSSPPPPLPPRLPPDMEDVRVSADKWLSEKSTEQLINQKYMYNVHLLF